MSVTASTATVTVLRRRGLYVGLSVLMAAIAIVGFSPGYIDAFTRSLSRPMVLHVHAVVFTGWLVLFGVQAALAAQRKIRAHQALGSIGIAYGVVLVVVGVYTTIVRSTALADQGNVLLYVALLDMVVFTGFFGAAVLYRQQPELHRRLMTVAAAGLLIAAVGRMDFLPGPPLGPFVRFLVWSSPLAIAVASDARLRRSVHPVYLIGFVVFAVRVWSVPVARTDEWRAFTEWVHALDI